MPRRRALTSAQLEDLFALPATEPDLIRHWTLGETDLAAINRRRGDANQLGYALQLCAFRYPGRLLRPGGFCQLSRQEELGSGPGELRVSSASGRAGSGAQDGMR
jgi:hypothetical protein